MQKMLWLDDSTKRRIDIEDEGNEDVTIINCIRPSTLDEALEILKEKGSKAKLIAGGTDLVIELRRQSVFEKTLIDISRLEKLRTIEINEQMVSIGAGTRFTDIVTHKELKKHCMGLWEACRLVGSPQIRNVGTIGGNICNGSPAADSVPPLLALDAQLTILREGSTRTLSLKDFYVNKGKVLLNEDEILYAITFKLPKEGENVAFEKLGLRKALAIARLSCSIFVSIGNELIIREIRIATGAMGTYPQREIQVEQMMLGKKLNEALIEDGAKAMGDIARQRLGERRSAAFKLEAIQGMFSKTLRRAVEEGKV